MSHQLTNCSEIPLSLKIEVVENAVREEIARVRLDEVSCVYGPVTSWRVGRSLGIDLLCINSICSFNCTYCQLGFIQVRINHRDLFVPTSKVVADFERSDWRQADIITFSGNGEPTLATNLGEVIGELKARSGKPTLVLTNGTLLDSEEVGQELALSDQVFLKLDAASEPVFQAVNRPVAGVTLEGIVDAAARFAQSYSGWLGLQCMFLRRNRREVEDFARLINRIRPREVQVNTPTRPYPQDWYIDSRGSHDGVNYPARPLKPLDEESIAEITTRLQSLTSVSRIASVYRKPS